MGSLSSSGARSRRERRLRVGRSLDAGHRVALSLDLGRDFAAEILVAGDAEQRDDTDEDDVLDEARAAGVVSESLEFEFGRHVALLSLVSGVALVKRGALARISLHELRSQTGETHCREQAGEQR